MSRFFKSAAFPILIVVVLAFFAQKLISPGDGGTKYTYGDFVTQLGNGDVKSVTLKNKDNSISVTLDNGKHYDTGFTDADGDVLTNKLQVAKAENRIDNYDVESRHSNGWLSLLTYVLPFLIFIGFWIFLMN